MLRHDGSMANKFFQEQPSRYPNAAEDSQHSYCSEKVQRPAQIAQQETNGNQIEEDTEGAGNTVVRNAPLAVDVANWHFANRSTVPGGKRRNETVQLAIQWYLL